jgi:hypothetical protein
LHRASFEHLFALALLLQFTGLAVHCVSRSHEHTPTLALHATLLSSTQSVANGPRHLPSIKDLPVASLSQQNSSSDGSRTPWQLLPLQSHQLVITSISFRCPSHLTSFVTIFWSSSVQSVWQPSVLFSSVAQNWSTVTPWAHARHGAVIALQQNCGFSRQCVGQHSPFGVTVIWSSLHSGSKHETALQSVVGSGKMWHVAQQSPFTA